MSVLELLKEMNNITIKEIKPILHPLVVNILDLEN